MLFKERNSDNKIIFYQIQIVIYVPVTPTEKPGEVGSIF